MNSGIGDQIAKLSARWRELNAKLGPLSSRKAELRASLTNLDSQREQYITIHERLTQLGARCREAGQQALQLAVGLGSQRAHITGAIACVRRFVSDLDYAGDVDKVDVEYLDTREAIGVCLGGILAELEWTSRTGVDDWLRVSSDCMVSLCQVVGQIQEGQEEVLAILEELTEAR